MGETLSRRSPARKSEPVRRCQTIERRRVAGARAWTEGMYSHMNLVEGTSALVGEYSSENIHSQTRKGPLLPPADEL